MPEVAVGLNEPITNGVPLTEYELQKAAESIEFSLQNSKPDTKTENLLHQIHESHKIDRPIRTAVVSINTLFYGGNEIAQPSAVRSQTRRTSEYVVLPDVLEFGTPGIRMSVVDSPGFGDDGGLSQDACNLYSIEQFFQNWEGPESFL